MGKFRLTITHDDCPENPREWDNLGTLVGWHGRQTIGDKQPECDPKEYLAGLADDEIILPVFMYEHGGVAFSTGAFSCQFDSGQVGLIHCSPTLVNLSREEIEACLKGEIETYSQWANGEVYGFQVEEFQPNKCAKCGHEQEEGTWEFVDGCGGFYGTEWDKNGLAEHVGDEHASLLADVGVTYE